MQTTTQMFIQMCPDAATAIRESYYMDDYFESFDTEHEAIGDL